MKVVARLVPPSKQMPEKNNPEPMVREISSAWNKSKIEMGQWELARKLGISPGEAMKRFA